MFVIDPKKERIAILEARKAGVPIVGLVDTNCDPDEVDYVIPGNDDAIRAVKLISAKIADAVLEARQGEQIEDLAASQPAVKESVPEDDKAEAIMKETTEAVMEPVKPDKIESEAAAEVKKPRRKTAVKAEVQGTEGQEEVKMEAVSEPEGEEKESAPMSRKKEEEAI